jgi:hypothetical protein
MSRSSDPVQLEIAGRPEALARNEAELAVMRELAESGRDGPVLMVNVNRYRPDSGYPDGQPYSEYLEGLASLVASLGGKLVRRLTVAGQPVGTQREAHEIVEIWYPSHQAFLDLPNAPGAERNYRLRAQCLEAAVIHRCLG